MQKRLISLVGLIFSVGVSASAQAQIPNEQVASSNMATNEIDLIESPQKINLDNSEHPTPRNTSSPIEVSTATKQSTTAAEQSTVRLEVSLSRRQVTVYNGDTPTQTYPIAVGRAGHATPTGTFEIRQMRQNPAWIHPITDQRIAGGAPGNPLGTRWIGFWTDGRNWIGFHGTTSPESIGQAVSHGCLRMHNADVEELFEQVERGTLVTVVD